jgi:CRISPR-associated endonuclease Csn1
MQSKQNLDNLTFGFDIGIASVGWAVLNEQRVIDLGVRCFDKAETAKEGESLNLARRTARLMRRRLRRRAWRLTKLSRLLKYEGLIKDVKVLKHPPAKDSAIPNLWQLRVDALNRKLTSEEWARVIYHLCKHRGFHWVSKAEKLKEDDSAGETGKVKKGLAATNNLMKEKGYRTAAEMVLTEFPDAQRNKQGEYSKALERELLSNEFTILFEAQRNFGNPHTSQALEEKLLDRKDGLFWAQKPSLSGEALLKMLGKCTFEKSEYRAPKASFTAERHVWLTKLNNLRLVVDGVMRPLNGDERRLVIDLPYNQASDLKYKQLKSILVKQAGLSESVRFAGLSYPSANQLEAGKAKDPEDGILVKIPAFQALRKALKEGLETEWQGLVNSAMAGDANLLDQIAWVLSVYKEDDEVERELNKLNLPNKAKIVDALLGVRFDKFSNLSLKALYKIVPLMEQGKRYDEACLEADYHHSQLVTTDDMKQQYLPPFYTARDKSGKLPFNENLDIPRNPVVLRALNQARKVCNALIKQYGSPYQVNIEMARDLSKPFDERQKIKRDQEEYRDRNQKDREQFNSEFNTTGALKGRDFEKWQLYREQQGKCAYSLQPVDLHRLFDQGYVEIDHALPYSRSFDDSKNNRVLVLTAVNRDKGNQTPYEYLDGKNDSDRWHAFSVWVKGNKSYREAKRNRLLKKEFGEKEAESFKDRNLNDTRYICRFFKNYVEQNLQLAENSAVKRCVVLSGQMTSFLRNRWGLAKVRSDSDRHHALDALVVAAANHSMVKRLSDYARRKELAKVSQGFVDITTGEIPDVAMFNQLNEHFPEPWENFRHEIEARLKQDDIEQLRAHCEKLSNYEIEDLASLKPLFVSRAPQRRNSGAAHKETIYGQTERLAKTNSVTQKVAVENLSLKDFGEKIDGEWVNCKLIDPHRNEKLYATLREWVAHHDAREKRAKEIEASLGRGKEKRQLTVEEKEELGRLRALPTKPTNDNRVGPVVRTVTTVIDKLSGIPIRHGVAKNDTMLRVDVFTKAGKYHLVPIYVHHALAEQVQNLPNRAIVAFKDENEWTLIDESFTFCFSLYPNDFVKVSFNNKPAISGYYSSCHRGTAAINVWSHDRNNAIGKDGIIEGIGVKTALSIEKFNVDVLGNVYPTQKEERRGLA